MTIPPQKTSMPLRERIEQQGYWLFRWRSYLPLLLLPLFAFALRGYGQLEHAFGWAAGLGWELGCIATGKTGIAKKPPAVASRQRKTSA